MSFEEIIEAAQVKQVQHLVKAAEYAEYKASHEMVSAYNAAQKSELELKSATFLHQRVLNACRPSITLGATIEKRGDMYLASAAGLSAEGDTPEIACQNFDRLWSQGEAE